MCLKIETNQNFCTFWSFRTFMFLMQGSKLKSLYSNGPLQKKVHQELGDRINPLITEKNEDCYREKPEVLALFGKFRLSTFSCMDQNQSVFELKIPLH